MAVEMVVVVIERVKCDVRTFNLAFLSFCRFFLTGLADVPLAVWWGVVLVQAVVVSSGHGGGWG